MNTPFVQLYFTLAPPGKKLLPYALFALRQQFHAAFCCAAGCSDGKQPCRGGSDSPCRAVFAQALATDPAALRRYQKPPLPFAFSVPVLPEKSRSGDTVELSLVITGEAISSLDLFIKAVRLLFGSSEQFRDWRVVSVEAAAEDGARTLVPLEAAGSEFASLPVLAFDELFSGGGGSCSRITVHFHTPVRLIHKGSPVQDISFSLFAGALFRRISSLAYYYGREELPHDFKWLARQSREIVSTRSEQRWVNRGGQLQGVEGSVVFSGELTDFIPFLHLGSRLNLGKGAAYGMGNFSFSVE
jgi:hypothetical protein